MEEHAECCLVAPRPLDEPQRLHALRSLVDRDMERIVAYASHGIDPATNGVAIFAREARGRGNGYPKRDGCRPPGESPTRSGKGSTILVRSAPREKEHAA